MLSDNKYNSKLGLILGLMGIWVGKNNLNVVEKSCFLVRSMPSNSWLFVPIHFF
jgi:hypothetical protein